MTVFPVRDWIFSSLSVACFPITSFGVGLLALAVLLAADVAVAATGPERANIPMGPPLRLESEEGARPVSTTTDVEERPLATVDPNSVGVLDEAAGGFGADLWQHTPRALVGRLLPALPAPLSSPTLRDLSRRLLLSAAPAPAGDLPDHLSGNLVVPRLQRLAALGDDAGVLALAAVTPPELHNDDFHQLRATALFLTGKRDDACTLVRARLRQTLEGFWLRARVTCHVLEDDRQGAQLGLQILQEKDDEGDAAFRALAESIVLDAPALPAGHTRPDVLETLLMVKAGLAPGPAMLAAADPGVLRVFAAAPFPMGTRLAAAERSAALGGIDGAGLAALYQEAVFSGPQLENPLPAAETMSGPLARALLVQGATAQTLASGRGDLLLKGWDLSRRDGVSGAFAAAILPLLREIEPSAGLIRLAPAAVRMYSLAGDPAGVADWVTLLRDERGRQSAAAAVLKGAWPLALVAIPDMQEESMPSGDLLRRRGMAKDTAKGAGDKDALLLMILGIFSDLPERDHWHRLLTDGDRAMVALPAPSLLYSLRLAAEELLLGETVLLSLVTLGQEDFAMVHPLVLEHAVAGLRYVGLEAEARALALEAMVLQGL